MLDGLDDDFVCECVFFLFLMMILMLKANLEALFRFETTR